MTQRIGDTTQALRRLTNGSRIHRLTLGLFPDVLRRQLSTARKYRRDLESFVQQAKGEVSLIDAHYIDEAAAAEVHAAICRMLMRNRFDKMSSADILICSKEIMKSKAARNAAIEKLGLDRIDANTIDALYTKIEDENVTKLATLSPVTTDDDQTTDPSSVGTDESTTNVNDDEGESP